MKLRQQTRAAGKGQSSSILLTWKATSDPERASATSAALVPAIEHQEAAQSAEHIVEQLALEDVAGATFPASTVPASDLQHGLSPSLDLLVLNSSAWARRLKDSPTTKKPWIMAADEMALLPALGRLGNFFIGGTGADKMIPTGQRTPEELAQVLLARKVKHYLAVSLCGLPSDILGERAGGANKAEEEREIRTMEAEAVKLDTYKGYSADGIKKEAHFLFQSVVEAWASLRTVDNVPATPRKHVSWPDPSHAQKANLGILQYGGSLPPCGKDPKFAANPALMLHTSMPLKLVRRIDFASDSLPVEAANPKYARELWDLAQAHKLSKEEVCAYMQWLVGYRLQHVACKNRDPLCQACVWIRMIGMMVSLIIT